MDIDSQVKEIVRYIDNTNTIGMDTRVVWVKGSIVKLVADVVEEQAGSLVAGQLRQFISRRFGL